MLDEQLNVAYLSAQNNAKELNQTLSIEHILVALINDSGVSEALSDLKLDIDQFRKILLLEIEKLPCHEHPRETPQQVVDSKEIERVILRAILQVQNQGDKRMVNGLDLLISIMNEYNSRTVQALNSMGINKNDLIAYRKNDKTKRQDQSNVRALDSASTKVKLRDSNKSYQAEDKRLKAMIYNPKEFRGWRSRLSANKKPILYIFAIIALITASFIIDDGYNLKYILKKIGIVYKQGNISIGNMDDHGASTKRIIPGLFSNNQVDFTNNIDDLEVKFKLTDNINNLQKYAFRVQIYGSDAKKVHGKVIYQVAKADYDAVNAKISFLMWGAQSLIASPMAKRDVDVCSSEIKRKEEKDDQEVCKNELQNNITMNIKTKPTDVLKIKIKLLDKRTLSAFYGINEDEYTEIGRYKFDYDLVLGKSAIANLHYLGKILECEEMRPIKIVVSSIGNGGIRGRTYFHSEDNLFDCKNKVVSKVGKDNIIHEIK